MSNFKDSLSAEELSAFYKSALLKNEAPWKGTGESMGNPELGIVEQAIDAVDDNCNFPIIEFLRGATYAVDLYLRNLEVDILDRLESGDTSAAITYAMRMGEIKRISDSLHDACGEEQPDDSE